MRLPSRWLALSLCACAPKPAIPPGALFEPREMPVTMRFADSVPLKNRALIYSAADDWRRATGGALQVEFGDSGLIDVLVTDSGPLGKCTSTEMAIRSDAPDAMFRGAALHEMGHKFGMDHLPTGVMMAQISPAENCVDELALRVACSAYHCTQPKATCR